jgi:hypothetical protein
MSLKTNIANNLLNQIYKNINFIDKPLELWLGLIFNSNELSNVNTGYSRVKINTDNFSDPINGIIKNINPIIFSKASVAWTINKIGLWSEQQGGELLQTILLREQFVVEPNLLLKFPSNSIQIGLNYVPDGFWQNEILVSNFESIIDDERIAIDSVYGDYFSFVDIINNSHSQSNELPDYNFNKDNLYENFIDYNLNIINEDHGDPSNSPTSNFDLDENFEFLNE